MIQGVRRLVVLAAIVTASQLVAQPVPPPAPPDQTTGEMAAQADAMNRRVTAEVLRGRRIRERASAKDPIKLACVNDGMVALLQAARIGEAAFAAFKLATSKHDQPTTLERFMDLTRAVDGVDAASFELRACVGGNQVEVHHQPFSSDPTDDCNTLGQWGCVSQSLEYVSLASPFTPR